MSLPYQETKDFLFQVQKKKNKKTDTITDLTKDLADRKNVLDLKIAVIVDISGSISSRQFKMFMEVLDQIKGLSQVKVIEIDTKIVAMYNYFKLRPDEVNRIVRLQGGGGTEFREAFTVIEKINPDATLVLTDGEIFDSVRSCTSPVGWILTQDGVKPTNYPFGEVIMRLPSAN